MGDDNGSYTVPPTVLLKKGNTGAAIVPDVGKNRYCYLGVTTITLNLGSVMQVAVADELALVMVSSGPILFAGSSIIVYEHSILCI